MEDYKTVIRIYKFSFIKETNKHIKGITDIEFESVKIDENISCSAKYLSYNDIGMAVIDVKTICIPKVIYNKIKKSKIKFLVNYKLEKENGINVSKVKKLIIKEFKVDNKTKYKFIVIEKKTYDTYDITCDYLINIFNFNFNRDLIFLKPKYPHLMEVYLFYEGNNYIKTTYEKIYKINVEINYKGDIKFIRTNNPKIPNEVKENIIDDEFHKICKDLIKKNKIKN